jgi:hypothetical protein
MSKINLDTLPVDKEVQAHGFRLCYNDDKHKYWIIHPDGNKHEVYGMTTIQKPVGSVTFNKDTGAAMSKSDTLINWAVGEVKKALLAGEPIEEAVRAHTKKSDYSKDFGKKVHNIIELATIAKQNGLVYNWTDSPEDKVAKKVIDNDIMTSTHTIAQELLVFAPSNPESPKEEWTNWVAGTFDRLVLRDGKIELQDHKTSTGVYSLDYFTQLMGYQFMLEWMMTDKNNTYKDTLSALNSQKIEARRINLAKKDGTFTDSWVSTNDQDDRTMLKATLDIFNTYKKYKSLFW